MRKIKFRAWDEATKKMHFDFMFIESGTEDNDWIVFRSDKENGRMPTSPNEKVRETDKHRVIFDNPYFRKQIKVMEYTGLKDKYGKDIYEEDIISNIAFTDKVVFKEGMFTTERSVGDVDKPQPLSVHDGLTVVGNIYENPGMELEERK